MITTNVNGCRETVEPGVNGELVAARDWRALCEAMRGFLQDPARCQTMGQAGLALVQKRFDVRKVNEAMIKALDL